MLIKCTIFYTKRCMYEQKWEYSYKETPVLANAGSGVFLIKGFFYSPTISCVVSILLFPARSIVPRHFIRNHIGRIRLCG